MIKEKNMKEIVYYKKENGKVPVLEFLNDLILKNPKLVAKILYKIDLLKSGKLGGNDVKFIIDDIYELRIKFSSNISRIFYFSVNKDEIVLLEAIIKKETKLKNIIIKKVIKYKKNYEKRFE